MEINEYKAGTVIKGKDLSGQMLGKIISPFHSKNKGENTSVPACKFRTETYFCLIKDICEYLDIGTKFAIVSIPDEEDAFVGEKVFYAENICIQRVMALADVETWEYFTENGADITADDNNAVRIAAEYGWFDVVQYLCEHGADVTADNNDALISAVYHGNFELLEYLHKNGADISAGNDYAIKRASDIGDIKAVKYLYENGADITADYNYPIRRAAMNGNLETVKYLYENGADITAKNNFALKWAKENGHQKTAEYLREQMRRLGKLE